MGWAGHMHGAGDQRDELCAATVTRLVNQAGAGDPRAAAADLLPLVYERLRALAGRKMQQERPDQTLQATSLVHEAYLRLVDSAKVQRWENRWHFSAAAAESMRRILVDNARRKGRPKRGAGQKRVDLKTLAMTVNDPPNQLVALDEALTRLAEEHPEKARLVNLRYLGGLTHADAAQAIGASARLPIAIGCLPELGFTARCQSLPPRLRTEPCGAGGGEVRRPRKVHRSAEGLPP